MKVSLNCLLKYIKPDSISLPDDWDQFHELLEDLGLEVKRVERESDDIIFTLELLANRGDHHCYTGIAREIHIRTGWPLVHPEVLNLARRPGPALARVNTTGCFAYTLTEYKYEQSKAKIAELDLVQKAMIEFSGTNLVTPAVDVTNLLNIELGQPMHVFDADKVVGLVVVRDSVDGESATLLGESKQTLLPVGTVVIADEEKILAVAGVMGCESSKPTAESRRLFLESGTFDPVRTRKAARALNVSSLSSARFERGADTELAIAAVHRAHFLLAQLGWYTDGLGLSLSSTIEPTRIELSLDRLNHFFNSAFHASEIETYLVRGGFELKSTDQIHFMVQVPTHRYWDVQNEEDLFEEVARAVGYNRLPSVMPGTSLGARSHPTQRRLEKLESVLLAHGFNEIFTDSFYGDQDIAKLAVPEGHSLSMHVRINNSETKAYSLLKNNNLVQALEAVATNLRIKNDRLKIFERNKRFIPDPHADNGLCTERQVIWCLALGDSMRQTWQTESRPFDLFACKSIVEQIGRSLGVVLRMRFDSLVGTEHEYLTFLHPKRAAVVEMSVAAQSDQWQVCGVLGEIHPGTVKGFSLKNARPYFIELDQHLLHLEAQTPKYSPPGAILPVKRDLCFGLYQEQGAGYIADWLLQASSWVENCEISDLFEPSGDEQGLRAVTFSLYLDPRRAGKDVFTGQELNNEIERLAAGIVETFGHELVQRR